MHRSFGYINQVPQSKDLIDICLSKTNRKTPTVIHPSYEINRIRNFYIRKVKFTAEEFNNKLSTIISDFPVMEDIHPFYGDLINILYDRDSYKIALGHLNSTKSKINQIMSNSLKLIKFGDSLYRCKCLKRAALGQMATSILKLKDSLSYLESVRQHLSRLPSIDPLYRTIIVSGFPNVGKSSFINNITNCKTEVQPYAFTTKSLYVGHFEANSLKYQIIDTPGILDHPLEDRNKVEMLSITALAHLKSSVMYFIDLSESCGYSLEEQISLFENISPLLNSQILIVFSKCDLLFNNSLSMEDNINNILNNNELIKNFINNKKYIFISSTEHFNENEAKLIACDLLLDERVDSKSEKVNHFTNRIRIVKPETINSKYDKNHLGESKIITDERETYIIKDKYDIIPEIYNGKNISDFIGENIYERLKEIKVPELRNYDIMSQQENKLYEEVNAARVAATMKCIFNKRSDAPVKNHLIDLSKENKLEHIKPNKNASDFYKKARTDPKIFYDKTPKHAFRDVSRKHGRTI